MRIAIIGAGVSGLTAAWLLRNVHEVQLFEAEPRAGGHTDTHEFTIGEQSWQVDSGFIVFNEPNYPNFCRLLQALKVDSQPTTMSFSVRNDHSGLEYNARDLNTLFCQRRNLLRPRHWRMLRDILRFYREAPAVVVTGSAGGDDPGPSTGAFLATNGYSEAFIEDHLLPMASALWSAPPGQILAFPIRYLVQFFANHRMLQVQHRPTWRVVRGGSSRYLTPLQNDLGERVHLATPVRSVRRQDSGVKVLTDDAEATFDRVVLACHSDQALALIGHPSRVEQSVLGAMSYQRNEVVIHTDTSVLPLRRAAWAAWNARVPLAPDQPCTVTYRMNQLQTLDAPVEFLVTLNQDQDIRQAAVLGRRVYHHPLYTRESVAAQQRFDEIDGVAGLHFCGAYWGWGFHEDGVSSALRVAERLGAPWGARAPAGALPP